MLGMVVEVVVEVPKLVDLESVSYHNLSRLGNMDMTVMRALRYVRNLVIDYMNDSEVRYFQILTKIIEHLWRNTLWETPTYR